MNVTKGLKCENVLKYFEDICAIPHGSGNTGAIASYCEEFAAKHGLRCHRDSLNNVIIRKSASAGYENAPVVIIQGHLDMVCEKTDDKIIDFKNEAITLMYEDGFLFADRTTLGGDDGIAIAYALAILEDDSLCHPEIEAVFTVDEETDMQGAKWIDVSLIKGRMLLNIDSEAEGVFTVSSAGTNVVKCSFVNEREKNVKPEYQLKISGLSGGHSGVEIHKGRANANALMGRALHRLSECGNINLTEINGGAQDNAITSLCIAGFVTDKSNEEKFSSEINAVKEEYYNEYKLTDPDINVELVCTQSVPDMVLCSDVTDNIITFLYAMPNGVMAMSGEIDGLVKTSLNCGIIKTLPEKIDVSFLVRSSVESEMTAVSGKVMRLAKALGASAELLSSSPAWEYKEDSCLRELCRSVYSDMFKNAPVIEAIHAGLECGIFSKRIPGVDCISYGPDIHMIHTPNEKLSVDSVERVWNFTVELLKRIK